MAVSDISRHTPVFQNESQERLIFDEAEIREIEGRFRQLDATRRVAEKLRRQRLIEKICRSLCESNRSPI